MKWLNTLKWMFSSLLWDFNKMVSILTNHCWHIFEAMYVWYFGEISKLRKNRYNIYKDTCKEKIWLKRKRIELKRFFRSSKGTFYYICKWDAIKANLIGYIIKLKSVSDYTLGISCHIILKQIFQRFAFCTLKIIWAIKIR